MIRKNLMITLLLLCGISAWGSGALKISGKIRVIKPTTLLVKDLNGNTIVSCSINKDGVFSTEEKNIIPDVYTVVLGTVEQNIYLESCPVTISGYLDEQNPEHSSLTFTGIDPFLAIQEYIPTGRKKDQVIAPAVKGKLTPGMAAALAYLADVPDYNSNKMLLDMIPDKNRNSLSATWLVEWVSTLSKRSTGAMAPDFTFIDAHGKEVSLKDFRGKIVVLDFCASWCGPCRKEMRNMLKIYNELKADDLEFISISLDDSEAKWRRMLKEEDLPWVMLWDKEGFPKSDKTPSVIQTAYGFYTIPFLVVIDKEGKILARKVRGDQVRETILNARKQ